MWGDICKERTITVANYPCHNELLCLHGYKRGGAHIIQDIITPLSFYPIKTARMNTSIKCWQSISLITLQIMAI